VRGAIPRKLVTMKDVSDLLELNRYDTGLFFDQRFVSLDQKCVEIKLYL